MNAPGRTKLFTTRPLRLHPAYVRRQWLYVGVASLLVVPFVLGALEALFRPRPSLMDAEMFTVIAVLGATPAVILIQRLYHHARLCHSYVEVHAPIIRRTEYVRNGVPDHAVTFTFSLPALAKGAVRPGERTTSVRYRDGSPILADPRGNSLVVLVSPAHADVFVVPRADLHPFLLEPSHVDQLRHRLVAEHWGFNFGRGLKNKDSVQQGLMMLLGAEARGALPPRPSEQFAATVEGYDPKEPVLSVQRLVMQVARSFGFQPDTIVVTFKKDLESAGLVEYEPGTGFFVEVREEYATRPRELLTVLAHEVAHVFLGTHGIQADNRFDNEVMTDLAAALWGYGALMIECHRNEIEMKKQTQGVMVTGEWVRNITELGYITPEECAYALAKVMDLGKTRKRAGRHTRGAYRTAVRVARAEAAAPPVTARSPLRRVKYLAHRWLSERGMGLAWTRPGGYAFESGKVVFPCPGCTQRMRLPTHRKGKATCPNCRMRLGFWS